jgi:phosphohistidine phosphatase
MLGMKTLLLLRHGKASGNDADCGDFERPLTKRGKRDVPKIGHLLRNQNLLPDIIVASSAKRCRKTADHIIEHSGYRGETRLLGDLYEANETALSEFLAALDDRYQRPLLIAHNPGMEQLLHRLSGSHDPLTTAALAHVELPIESWRELTADTRGTLHNLWQPGELEND